MKEENRNVRFFVIRLWIIPLILVLLSMVSLPAFGDDEPFLDRKAIFEDDPWNLQKKLPIVLSAELFASALSGMNYFEFGKNYGGAITGGFGVLLIFPNLNTEQYSAYQDLGQRIAGTATGVLLVGLCSYLVSTTERDPTNRVRNAFIGYQVALAPFLLKILFF